MVSLKSAAKINIGLRILGRKPDNGYHLIETVFQEIDFHDDIFIEINDSGHFTLECSDPTIPVDESNTINLALNQLKPFLPESLGAQLFLNKNIPHGAGLGGGSANAAAILNHFLQYIDSDCDLHSIAARIGADVTFFLKGGTQYGTGIGEILTPFSLKSPQYLLLVIPPFPIKTQWAYQSLKIPLTQNLKKAILSGFSGKPLDRKLFENEFEQVILPAYPQIGRIKELLYESGASFASLSGSGSTVYGMYETAELRDKASGQLKDFGKIILSSVVSS